MKSGTALDGSERKASRQCWECLKRRLVCDHTLPHCKKCIKAGKECPGYDEKKPLQWVQPGKVTSRRRRKDAPAKTQSASPASSTSTSNSSSSPGPTSTTASKTKLPQNVSDELRTALVTFADRYEKEISNPTATPAEVADRCGRLVEEFWVKNSRIQQIRSHQSEEQLEKVMKLGDRRRIEEIVRNRCNDGAREILKDEEDALKRLEKLLRHMDLEDIPCYNLTNETSDVVQAVHYYNLRIFPTLQALKELAPNPSIMIFPVGALHLLPPSIHHILVCISLNHFIHSLPAGANRLVISSNACKVYQHRGYAIRMLSEKIGKDKTRCSDLTMTSVLMFLCLELQQAAATDWRTHAMGLKQLIDMRGGHMKVIAEKPYLAPCLILFVLIVTYANTTSAPCDMIHLTPSLQQHITDLSNIYSFIFPMTLCPPTLFYEIVRINHLRSRAVSTVTFFDATPPDPSMAQEAHELLARIESFDSEDWAQPGKHFNEWVLLGTIHQSAAALYCTMSLQALGLLPESLEMNAMRAVHGDRLLASLKEGSQSERLEKYMTWPLVVMGVEAIYRDHETRRWLDKAFVSASQSLGTSTPLKARALLTQYWERGIPGWEECFISPQAFIV